MINVTCAIIRNEDDEVLVVQRGIAGDHPYKWEFPGGKVHEGEEEEDCIIREISEELSMEIVICSVLKPVIHDYGHKEVRLVPFVCDTLADLPELNEHIRFRWVKPSDLEEIDFSEADIEVARNYVNFLPRMNGEETARATADIESGKIKELLEGHISVDACRMIALSAVETPGLTDLLMEYSLGDERTLAFRSSWCLTMVAESAPELVSHLISPMILSLPGLDNESVTRSFLKMINTAEFGSFSEREQGTIAEVCFTLLNNSSSAIAIKVYAMEALYRLTEIYPELRDELAASISAVTEQGSPGVRSKGRNIMEKMRKDSMNRRRQ